MELLERGDDEQQEALSVLFRHRSEPVSLVISSTRVWQLTGWLEAVRDTNTANNRSVQIDGPLETHAIPFTPPKIIASNYPRSNYWSNIEQSSGLYYIILLPKFDNAKTVIR